MSSKDDFEARKHKVFRRLGTDTPVCVICACADWRCLELHHIAGQHHHDDCAIVCRNCHRKLSDAQRDYPASDPENPVSVIGQFLIGLAELFAMLATRLAEFGRELIAREKAGKSFDGELS